MNHRRQENDYGPRHPKESTSERVATARSYNRGGVMATHSTVALCSSIQTLSIRICFVLIILCSLDLEYDNSCR
jgi:hypothetical protein